MVNDSIKVVGDLIVLLYDQNGNKKDERKVKNLVVTNGKNHIASRLTSNTAVVMSHMAVGSSNTAPSTSQTALTTELARVALDSTTLTNATSTYTATFGAGVGTGTLAEAAILNASSGGTMLCRTNFNEVNKAAGDTIVITWNVTIS